MHCKWGRGMLCYGDASIGPTVCCRSTLMPGMCLRSRVCAAWFCVCLSPLCISWVGLALMHTALHCSLLRCMALVNACQTTGAAVASGRPPSHCWVVQGGSNCDCGDGVSSVITLSVWLVQGLFLWGFGVRVPGLEAVYLNPTRPTAHVCLVQWSLRPPQRGRGSEPLGGQGLLTPS